MKNFMAIYLGPRNRRSQCGAHLGRARAALIRDVPTVATPIERIMSEVEAIVRGRLRSVAPA